jgi:hypothetical protein
MQRWLWLQLRACHLRYTFGLMLGCDDPFFHFFHTRCAAHERSPPGFVLIMIATVSALRYFIPRGTSLSNVPTGTLLDEAHQVDLSDVALRHGEPPLSRFGPPLHRHRHVYFKPAGASTIAVPDVVLRGSYVIVTFSFCVSLVTLGTFAPELEREPGILVHAVAMIVAEAQMELRRTVALKCCFFIPFGSFFDVRRVVPITKLVTLPSDELTFGVSTFCRSQIPGRRLPVVTLNPFDPTVKCAKIPLARGVPTLCRHATKLERQLGVCGQNSRR